MLLLERKATNSTTTGKTIFTHAKPDLSVVTEKAVQERKRYTKDTFLEERSQPKLASKPKKTKSFNTLIVDTSARGKQSLKKGSFKV